jgi:pSer/pThr/pTyr-binding forkhead associated (FHA) protein
MPKRIEEHPILIAQTGPLKGQRFVLDRALVIGREASCDVTIPDRQVSRFHARVTPEEGSVTLEDLGSKNGTHRNGESISGSVDLKDGDLVQIALIQSFMFLTSDSTLPLTEELTRPGRLRLDTRSRGVWVYENSGQVVERSKLVSEAWGDEEAVGVSDEALDALLRRLRERIASVDPTHNYIVTVRGHGVRLDNPPAE